MRLRRGHIRALAMAICMFAGSGVVFAQEPLVVSYEFQDLPREYSPVFLPSHGTPKKIDGELQDECWKGAASLTLASDMPGGSVSRNTTVRACYDDKALYFGFECAEPAIGDLPVAAEPPHDVMNPENVQIWISEGTAQGNFFLLSVDPNGGMYDWSLDSGLDWNPKWTSASKRFADGWTAEVAIPLASLNLPSQVAGSLRLLNICRDVSATGEQCAWSPTLGNRYNPSAWGTIFFGSTAELAKVIKPSSFSVYPARWNLSGFDKSLRAIVKVDPGSAQLKSLKLTLGVESRTVAKDALPAPFTTSLNGQRLEVVMNATIMPEGDFTLYGELRDAAGALIGRVQSPMHMNAREVAPASRTLKLFMPAYDLKTPAAASWPIGAGVILPEGALHSASNIRLLDEQGVEMPVSGQIRGRWPGDGSVRWLSLDFQADLTKNRPRTFTLEYGPDVKGMPARGFKRDMQALRVEIVQDARVTDFQGSWWINTGNLLFTINHDQFSGVTEAWVDADGNGQYDWFEQILNARGGGAGPYLVDGDGRTYRLSADRKARVSVEESNANPFRIVLRAEGLLMPEGGFGPDMGRCVMQITSYFGQPFIKVRTTFYLNERSSRMPLNEIGVEERLDGEFSKKAKVVLGVPSLKTYDMKDVGQVYMMKVNQEDYVLQSLGRTKISDSGKGAQDWSVATTPNRGLAMIMENMAQEYPKALSVCPDRRMIAHFWPPFESDARMPRGDVNRYNVGALGFVSDGNQFDLHVPLSYGSGLKDQEGLSDFDAVRRDDRADPMGLALSYETYYVFLKGQFDPQALSALAQAFAQEPRAYQDPESMAASGAIGSLLSPERRDKAVAMVARLMELNKRLPAGGDINDLDVRRKWLPDDNRWGLDGYWMGSRGDLPYALWLLYAQTGRPELLDLAKRNMRHFVNVDFCHEAEQSQTVESDPLRRKLTGGFGDFSTPVHWIGTWHTSDRHARIDGLLLCHYLTGDSQPLEAALLWADAARDYGQPSFAADGLAFLTNLDEMLTFRHSPALLQKRGECADYMFNMPITTGQLREWMPGIREYARKTGDPRVRFFLTRAAEKLNLKDDNIANLGLLRDLRELTGDSKYDANIAAILTSIENRMDKPDFSWEEFCAYVFHGG